MHLKHFHLNFSTIQIISIFSHFFVFSFIMQRNFSYFQSNCNFNCVKILIFFILQIFLFFFWLGKCTSRLHGFSRREEKLSMIRSETHGKCARNFLWANTFEFFSHRQFSGCLFVLFTMNKKNAFAFFRDRKVFVRTLGEENVLREFLGV